MNSLILSLALLWSQGARDLRALPPSDLLTKLGSDSTESGLLLRAEAHCRAMQPHDALRVVQEMESIFPASPLVARARLVEAWSFLQAGEHRRGLRMLASLQAGTDRPVARQARETVLEWTKAGQIPASELLAIPSIFPLADDTLLKAVTQALPPRPLVAVLPLTGAYSQIGRRVLRGAQLAAGEAKERLIQVDEPTDPVETALLVRGILAVTRPKAVVGPLLSNTSTAAALELARANPPVVQVLPAATSPGIAQLAPSTWQINITTSEQGRKAASVARDCFKAAEVHLLWPKGDYGDAIGGAFRDEFQRLGGRIGWQRSYTAGSTDFRALLESLRRTLADQARRRKTDTANLAPVVFVPGENPSEALALTAQASQLGMKVRWIGASGWHSRQFLLETSGRMDGAVLVTDNIPDESRPAWKSFAQKWRAAENDAPDRLAALGWDATQVALQSPVPMSWQGAQADIRFDPLSRSSLAVGVVRVEKNAFVGGCAER